MVESESEKDELFKSLKVQNYLRLQYLLKVTAATHLRQLFTNKWKTSEGSDWDNLRDKGNNFVQSYGALLYKKAKRIQKKYLQEGNIIIWDLPLLVDALKCFQAVKASNKQNNETKHYDKLKEVRNQQEHLGSIEMNEDLFNRLWQDASDALLSLGISQDELETAKTTKLQIEQCSNPEDKINQINLKKANELKHQGNLLFKEKNFEKAILLYSEASSISNLLNDYLAILHSNLSISFLKLEDFQNAKEEAQAAMLLNPTWWKGYYRLASVYQELKKYPKALKYYEIALGMAPSNSDVRSAKDICRNKIKELNQLEYTEPLSFYDTFKMHADIFNKLGNFQTTEEAEAAERSNYESGLPFAICGHAFKSLHGIGFPQNFEMAARIFAKAAAKENAEGMYNLALLTMEGKGVQGNIFETMKLLHLAAEQDPLMEVEIVPGFLRKVRNIGVMESQHALGFLLENGQSGIQDFQKAISWYRKAAKNDGGNSANNLGLIYANAKGVDRSMPKALNFWKVGALKGCVRAMENLAYNYRTLDVDLAQKWYTVGIENGSIHLPPNKVQFGLQLTFQGFDSNLFLKAVKEEMIKGPYRKYLLKDIPKNSAVEILSNLHHKSDIPSTPNSDLLSDEYKKGIILKHRDDFKQIQEKGSFTSFTTQPPKLQSKPVKSLFDLKPIFLKDMNQKKDHIYEEFAIKLTVIEDAIVGLKENKYVAIVGKDGNGDIQRVFLFNYPQNKETQNVLGFGSRITVLNPYFQVRLHTASALRIDDPSLLIIHKNLRDPSQCRFCGKEKGTIVCEKCRRVYYCSIECLKIDAEGLRHELVCVNHFPYF